MELNEDNQIDQHTRDLDELKENLHIQTKRLTKCGKQLAGQDMEKIPRSNLDDLRDEMEKKKLEQTRMSLKAEQEAILTMKERADTVIQQLEQSEEKLKIKMDSFETTIETMMDYKEQLDEMRPMLSSMDRDMADLRTDQEITITQNETLLKKEMKKLGHIVMVKVEKLLDDVNHHLKNTLSN